MEKLLDIRELADRLRVPVSWVYDRTRLKGPEHIPHYKIGKYIRFKESEVATYLAARKLAKDEAGS